MGNLVCGGIAPHGFSIIEEISGKECELFKPTRYAMDKLGKIIISHKPDTIVILTPRYMGNGMYEKCSSELERPYLSPKR